MTVAPYGQEDIGNLRSIFEMPHLRRRAIFLDTQCAYLIYFSVDDVFMRRISSAEIYRSYACTYWKLHF